MKKYIIAFILMFSMSFVFANHNVMRSKNETNELVYLKKSNDKKAFIKKAIPVIVTLRDPQTGEAYAECLGLLYPGENGQPSVVILVECRPI